MTTSPRIPSQKISALVSDVDGTLVTGDKLLTPRALDAVASLHARGIKFAIVSSRPPRGLQGLIAPLALTTPVSGFNGGVIASTSLTMITEHLLSPEIVQQAVDLLEARNVQVWVFSGEDWLARQSGGFYIDREKKAVGFSPKVVDHFDAYFDKVAKIVGVSKDFDHLAECEREMQTALVGHATVARSQSYYLDITHSLANKGAALSELSKLLSVPLNEIAVIGDGGNDVAMFDRSGLSIAMGNASPEVQQAADFVTDSNNDDGFAKAVERFILGDARTSAPTAVVQDGGCL
ncbi:MAG: Cof-type HAD-IIB family hydrolase [Parvibaculaceae bacterium]